MKKKLLFVIESLDCAGAEKSLVTLLSLLDYTRFEVDLMLFAHGEMLEKLVPEDVTILKPLSYLTFAKLNMKSAFLQSLKLKNFDYLKARLKYSWAIRKKKCGNIKKARLFWKNISSVIEDSPKTYDIAISYSQGVPTFYVAEKVKAEKKYAWVNTSYKLEDKEKIFQKNFYQVFTKIIAVSDTAKNIFLKVYPEFSPKINVIYDINDFELISKMSYLGKSFEGNFSGNKILTIGRLSEGKGYDIALEACKKLKNYGIDFKWYVLGKGPLENQIKNYIKDNDLESHFILIGVEANPYSKIKNSDIYVQTSKFEGFGLAIAEARMLNVPVVTTNFDSVYNQMINGKNGLVVEMNSEAVFQGILKLIQNQSLKKEIIDYLKNEKKGNLEELDKFYQLIG
ncbi:glycosyltransferase [Falsibacillus pallidus]|uniref:Glycosyltransferase involved in cell wall biosynthesis n=1 Tax=Falsibacillus pallidus TaxID=493781 RepID=A0A370GQD7_9BACI|nr:glycosyltransferase [Falsibacillus pallidus]RDI45721.1 glycosyltransferase involved in cell wall biosynthesis [Falsibacillus pallidus]